MIPKTIVHLLSGGLDSVTLLYDLQSQGHRVHCLLFDYHQRHAQELSFAKIHCDRLGLLRTTIELPDLKGLNPPDWVVPFRNPIMLALAVNVAVVAGADTITIGCNISDREQFPDCRPYALEAMNKLIAACGYSIEVCAPYIHTTKQRIGELAKQFGVSPHEVWSCYIGGSTPCGTCPACIKLKEALA